MVLIESFDHQGRGIGRINNKIVFVKNAIPGDIVELKIEKEKKNYTEASIKKIIKESNKRIKPICPHANKFGGCSLMNISSQDVLKSILRIPDNQEVSLTGKVATTVQQVEEDMTEKLSKLSPEKREEYLALQAELNDEGTD